MDPKLKLIVFDVDGTLAKAFTLRLLPKVKEFFDLVFHNGCSQAPKVALATNQGGVGMRFWMESEGFGKPQGYPTEEAIEQRLEGLLSALGADPDLPVYAAYRYRTKEGKWTPVPEGREEDPRWQAAWRKPRPGMLLEAMKDAGVRPEETLYVGDSSEDQAAAQAAGCKFTWAHEFFEQDWENCKQLQEL